MAQSVLPGTVATSPGVLFIDLDGTLIASDVFAEALVAAVKQRPVAMLRFPLWVLHGGRAGAKHRLAAESQVDPALLPYRPEVLDLIRRERAAGKRIVLATASDVGWARRVAEHLGLFDDVLASDGQNNLKGAAKLAAIEAYCREHDFESFAYAGDSRPDLPIWRRAAVAYVVAPSEPLRAAAAAVHPDPQVLGKSRAIVAPLWRVMRPWQWAKNILIFVPLVLQKKYLDWQSLDDVLLTLLAFFCFSFAASAVYVLNDLFDLANDRVAPGKHVRPFASGELPLAYGPPLVLVLAAVSLLIASLFLPGGFFGILLFYLALTTAYSIWLKHVELVDVLLLAGLYTLRILAGGAAIGETISPWLLAFSVFFFTSLAFAKRYEELLFIGDAGGEAAGGRGYRVADRDVLLALGPATGCIGVLVLAIYLSQPDVQWDYAHPRVLWLVCPLFLYWVIRIWLLAARRQLRDDPVSFALHDGASVLVLAASVILLLLASSPHW